MAITRRAFLGTMGAGGAALALPFPFVVARGREAATGGAAWSSPLSTDIRLDSNENPYGPAPQALDAIQEIFAESCRYPDLSTERLVGAIAKHVNVPADHVLQGSGSGEILKVAVEAFTGSSRPLVTASPTFELPSDRAKALKIPVTAVPVGRDLRIDLERMAAESGRAGLVFLCNPNNPTATVHGESAMRDTVTRILRSSPDTMILVDEAYHEYVTDPSYRSLLPLALEEPRVIVSRTFSKVYGMAGLRVGFAVARPETLNRMRPHLVPNNVNVLASAAAWTSLSVAGHAERERAKNTEARSYARRFLESAGYTVAPSETNFLMVDIRREITPVREACRKQGVLVGRPFPPLTTQLRLSIGTLEEMRKAMPVLAGVLGT